MAERHEHTGGFQQCSHGRCLNHSPNWERVGEPKLVQNPTPILGRVTYITKRCCGDPMQRVKKVVERRCTKCGRTDTEVLDRDVALCGCCGYHFSFVSIFTESTYTNAPPPRRTRRMG